MCVLCCAVLCSALLLEMCGRPQGSRLSEMVPTVRQFFTPLPLREAFIEFDRKYCITKRKFVYPTFNEIRQVCAGGMVCDCGGLF